MLGIGYYNWLKQTAKSAVALSSFGGLVKNNLVKS